jgi:hypothetical protein
LNVRNFVTHALTLFVTLHAVLGCCWHEPHEHRDSASTCDTHQVVSSGTSDQHHCDTANHEGDDHPTEPKKCSGECDNTCKFLRGQKTQFVNLVVLSPLDQAQIVAVSACPQTVFSELSMRERSEPPLRMHLFYQLLLI